MTCSESELCQCFVPGGNHSVTALKGHLTHCCTTPELQTLNEQGEEIKKGKYFSPQVLFNRTIKRATLPVPQHVTGSMREQSMASIIYTQRAIMSSSNDLLLDEPINGRISHSEYWSELLLILGMINPESLLLLFSVLHSWPWWFLQADMLVRGRRRHHSCFLISQYVVFMLVWAVIVFAAW